VRVHYLQHVDYEPPGYVVEWASKRGHEIVGTHLYEGESLPDPDAFDWLVVMGGPMGVYDTQDYPWLEDEQALIREAMAAGKGVLGICLGAQLVAAAMGAEVYPAEAREIGWFPVQATSVASESPAFEPLGETYEAFHWHGDTFDLPAGATRAARTDACENQAFVAEDGRVVGLQFHLEVTPETVADLVGSTESLDDAPHVQGAATIRAGVDRIDALHRRLDPILHSVAAGADS
jgi:GMP synthase-like glutamine amidotransferase